MKRVWVMNSGSRYGKLQRSATNVALKAAPPTIALLGVIKGSQVTDWANRHDATLLLILFALVGSLLHPVLRYFVITTLCYGVAFLAAKDIFFPQWMLPASLRSSFYLHCRMLALSIVSLLTLSAAIAESVRPGAVWARRCYFGGASLYFLGTGVINYRNLHSWQSLMMIITGVAAMIGALFANRIVELEKEDDTEVPKNDESYVESTHQAHVDALKSREWHDPTEGAI